MLFLEGHQIVMAGNVNDSTAITGDYVSLKHAKSCAVVYMSGVGTAGQDPTVSLFQATAVAGTGAKDLNPSSVKTFKKQAATDLTSTAAWSDASGDITANDITNATLAEQVAIIVTEVDADDLDVDGGFDCIRADVSDPGAAAQPHALFYILTMEEQRAPASAVSVIAD